MLLPPRFAAFLDNSFDTGRAVLLECIRLSYNYENLYRIIPLTSDEYRHEFPDHMQGRVLDTDYNPTQRSSGTLEVQLSSTQTTHVQFCVTPFNVQIEDEPNYYDEYNRNLVRRNQGPTFPLVLLSSQGRILNSQSTRHPPCVDLSMPSNVRRILTELRNNMPNMPNQNPYEGPFAPFGNHRRRRGLRTPSPPRYRYTGFHDMPPNWDSDFEEIHPPRRRRDDIMPPPPPRPRDTRHSIRGAGAGGAPPAGEPRQIIVQQQPRGLVLPSERVCVALARDFIQQQEPCPILQEPLTWGSIAVTACHCVFSGDSLAIWAAEHTSCPSCRQSLTYRVVQVEKPTDEVAGQPPQRIVQPPEIPA